MESHNALLAQGQLDIKQSCSTILGFLVDVYIEEVKNLLHKLVKFDIDPPYSALVRYSFEMAAPIPLKYFAKAQTEFKLPLIANENAFLGDVFTR